MTVGISVKLLPVTSKAWPNELSGTTAIVFDVLRATSSIVTALAVGYQKIYPVVNQNTAKQLAASTGSVLAGERGGEKIAGFPYGNSPWQFWVDGRPEGLRQLVLTTSNGTRAIHLAAAANQVLVGSLLNARAVALRAIKINRPIVLLCAGTNGDFALEDFLGAGLVLVEIVKATGELPPMADLANAAYLLAKEYYHQPLVGLTASRHGHKLLQLGCMQDLQWCAQLNKFDFVPILSVVDGKLVVCR